MSTLVLNQYAGLGIPNYLDCGILPVDHCTPGTRVKDNVLASAAPLNLELRITPFEFYHCGGLFY